MTEEGIALEYEMYLASEGKHLKTCFKCNTTTHRENCPSCGALISTSQEFDKLLEQIQEGKSVDISKALIEDKWEPVDI